MTNTHLPSGTEIEARDRKQGLLMDLFYFLPETGIFDGADNTKHALIATMLQSLSIEKLEELLILAESNPEIFRHTIENLLEHAAATQKKIREIVGGILPPAQKK